MVADLTGANELLETTTQTSVCVEKHFFLGTSIHANLLIRTLCIQYSFSTDSNASWTLDVCDDKCTNDSCNLLTVDELGVTQTWHMLCVFQKYVAVGEFGKATDTLDATGSVTLEKGFGKSIHSIFQIHRHSRIICKLRFLLYRLSLSESCFHTFSRTHNQAGRRGKAESFHWWHHASASAVSQHPNVWSFN